MRPQGVQLRDDHVARDYAYTERDPLANNTSPQVGGEAFSDSPYGRGGSLDLSDAYVTDNTYPAMRADSVDTHHSRSPLRHEAQATFPPLGQPIHPGASVMMQKGDSSGSTPEKRYGANAEKTGYRSPRARSHDRAGSSGLGNWQGAGGNNSPYGPLGAQSAPGSGLASAASSNPNLLYAVSSRFGPSPVFGYLRRSRRLSSLLDGKGDEDGKRCSTVQDS